MALGLRSGDNDFVRLLHKHQAESKKIKALLRKIEAKRIFESFVFCFSTPSSFFVTHIASLVRTGSIDPDPTFETLELKFEDYLLAKDPNETMNLGEPTKPS